MALKKLAIKLRNLLGAGRRDESFFEDLEDLLIEGDLGALVTMEVITELKKIMSREHKPSEDVILRNLKDLLKGYIKVIEYKPYGQGLNIILVLGINGVGKTTTIAKLGNFFLSELGKGGIILSAGDTFRAGAIEQLRIHGERLGLKVVHQEHGSDAGAVIYDSIESALSRGTRLIIADTAGRMHNKVNLVKELEKLDKIIKRKVPESSCHSLLVIDATTGQNGYQQAEIFNEAIGIDSIALTKYDSASRGGIVVPISRKLGIPFSFIGSGEKLTDLNPFNVDHYLDTLLGI